MFEVVVSSGGIEEEIAKVEVGIKSVVFEEVLFVDEEGAVGIAAVEIVAAEIVAAEIVVVLTGAVEGAEEMTEATHVVEEGVVDSKTRFFTVGFSVIYCLGIYMLILQQELCLFVLE